MVTGFHRDFPCGLASLILDRKRVKQTKNKLSEPKITTEMKKTLFFLECNGHALFVIFLAEAFFFATKKASF